LPNWKNHNWYLVGYFWHTTRNTALCRYTSSSASTWILSNWLKNSLFGQLIIVKLLSGSEMNILWKDTKFSAYISYVSTCRTSLSSSNLSCLPKSLAASASTHHRSLAVKSTWYVFIFHLYLGEAATVTVVLWMCSRCKFLTSSRRFILGPQFPLLSSALPKGNHNHYYSLKREARQNLKCLDSRLIRGQIKNPTAWYWSLILYVEQEFVQINFLSEALPN
jgi:hypothetical protein